CLSRFSPRPPASSPALASMFLCGTGHNRGDPLPGGTAMQRLSGLALALLAALPLAAPEPAARSSPPSAALPRPAAEPPAPSPPPVVREVRYTFLLAGNTSGSLVQKAAD